MSSAQQLKEKEEGEAKELSPEIISQLKQAFQVIDVGKDNKIDAEELMIILNAVTKKEMQLVEVQKLIADVDKDGGGEIDEDEFLTLMKEQMKDQQQDEELIAAFKFFGAQDEHDKISFETMKEALKAQEENDFTDEDLLLIFNEIAGASEKPITGGTKENRSQDDGAANQLLSFKDFMLMMMAK